MLVLQSLQCCLCWCDPVPKLLRVSLWGRRVLRLRSSCVWAQSPGCQGQQGLPEGNLPQTPSVVRAALTLLCVPKHHPSLAAWGCMPADTQGPCWRCCSPLAGTAALAVEICHCIWLVASLPRDSNFAIYCSYYDFCHRAMSGF